MVTQSIGSTAYLPAHPDIARRTSISALILSIAIMGAGILSFAFVTELRDDSSATGMALMVAGTALFLWGTFRLFWKSKETIYLPTGSIAKEQTFFFEEKYLEQLAEIVEQERFGTTQRVPCRTSGSVRLDVTLSQDNRFAAIQLFRFIPYAYTPVTPVHYLTGNNATALSAFLLKSQGAC